MAEADELFTLRNLFYLSNFQEAIAEAGTLSKLKTEALKLERDAYVYRSQIGLGEYSRVISAIRDDSPLAMQAVKQLAVYLSAPSGQEGQSSRASAVAKVDSIVGTLAEADAAGSSIVQAMAGIIHIHEEQYEAALRAVRSGASLELMALHVQILLRLDRPDMADKQVKLMQEKDDEACLTQLSAAAVCLALGGVRVKEAGLLYKDSIDRYGETVPVLNGAAVAALSSRQYAEAGKHLQDALAKDGDNAETLANMIALLQHTGKGGETGQYIDRLRRVAPSHPFVVGWTRVESAFDRVAASYA